MQPHDPSAPLFNPFRSPIIRKTWYDKIERGALRPEARVWGKRLRGSCWEWRGWDNGKGPGLSHGIVRVNGKRLYIHRYVYATFWGLDEGALEAVDHLCRVRLCFSPHHLEHVSRIENHERGDGPEHQFRVAGPAPLPVGVTEEDIGGLLG